VSLIDTSQVIVKRLPVIESTIIPSDDIIDIGIPCRCIDDIFNVAIPTCKHCNGSGILRPNVVSEEVITHSIGTKKVWITTAKVAIDNIQNVIFDDDDDDTMIADIHIFFNPQEDIMVGDIVIPTGQQVAYVVQHIQEVRDINNVLMIDCAAELYVPPVNT